MKNIYNYFLGFLTIVAFTPFFAPIFMQLGFEPGAKIIYFIYSFTCHQFDSRSVHLFDYQIAWCARDTAIWLSVWLVAVFVKFSDIKPIKLYWLIPFVVPIALDGGIQTIFTMLDVNPIGLNTGMPLYISNNFSRFLTGAIFGVGLSLWISPALKVQGEKLKIKSKVLTELLKDPKKISLLAIFIMFVVYLNLIFIWNITSKKYKPEGALDMVVRTPYQDFFRRRGHGICPTSLEDAGDYKNPINNLLAWDCFF